MMNKLTIDELTERIREHENLVLALKGGEVDAVVVQEQDGVRISRLESDEPLYRTIVDTLPQGVATVLSNGTIVYCNHHLSTLMGSLALGSNISAAIAEQDEARFASMLQRALLSPQEGLVTFRWTTGEAPALVSAIRLPVATVDAIGLVIVDVRDQVARKAAEEASQAKDDLLASVSHELRTPLASINGWVQFLGMQLQNAPEEITSALQHLKNAVIAETKIVDDLLDLSRSEKGALSLTAVEFDVRNAVRMAASFVELQARNKSLSLNVDVPDEPLIVRGDADRLRQVFVNLLSNAVKFTAEGGVSIRSDREDNFVVIAVADTGIGISKEFLPFVFEPFRRGDAAKNYPGLGIGLAISRRLIEAHGGSIEAASAGPNAGATFIVRLRLV